MNYNYFFKINNYYIISISFWFCATLINNIQTFIIYMTLFYYIYIIKIFWNFNMQDCPSGKEYDLWSYTLGFESYALLIFFAFINYNIYFNFFIAIIFHMFKSSKYISLYLSANYFLSSYLIVLWSSNCFLLPINIQQI